MAVNGLRDAAAEAESVPALCWSLRSEARFGVLEAFVGAADRTKPISRSLSCNCTEIGSMRPRHCPVPAVGVTARASAISCTAFSSGLASLKKQQPTLCAGIGATDQAADLIDAGPRQLGRALQLEAM